MEGQGRLTEKRLGKSKTSLRSIVGDLGIVDGTSNTSSWADGLAPEDMSKLKNVR